ncbi:hypothetical protein HMPREF1992_00652 [Selenomonas sp. oral taxon 892 str. F0426]|nr:hypothetical protein HMPREF1992_00652 [Selenomonas sp. oral taxon 892 str. F0426]
MLGKQEISFIQKQLQPVYKDGLFSIANPPAQSRRRKIHCINALHTLK